MKSVGSFLAYFQLKSLNLSHNKLTDDEVLIFTEYVKDHQTLSNLDLSFNHIADQNTGWLKKLILNSNLSVLNLKSNSIPNRVGEQTILEALKILSNFEISENAANDKINYRPIKVQLENNLVHLNVITEIKNMYVQIKRQANAAKSTPNTLNNKLKSMHIRSKSLYKLRTKILDNLDTLKYQSKKVKCDLKLGEQKAEHAKSEQELKNITITKYYQNTKDEIVTLNEKIKQIEHQGKMRQILIEKDLNKYDSQLKLIKVINKSLNEKVQHERSKLTFEI